MNLLLQLTQAKSYSISLGLIALMGSISVIVIGSIAWYNSKKPAGWENAEQPNIVPNVNPASMPSSPDA